MQVLECSIRIETEILDNIFKMSFFSLIFFLQKYNIYKFLKFEMRNEFIKLSKMSWPFPPLVMFNQ